MPHRILIAVTHLLGSGHLSRAAMIAAGLAEAGHDVTLASGGMPVPTIKIGPYPFVQLPPVRVVGTDYANLLDDAGSAVGERYRSRRIAILTGLVDRARPDVLITEHFPFGRRQLADEFVALIDAAKNAHPKVRVLASIRDVLIAPSKASRLTEVAQRIAASFDAVLVHGDETVLPLEKSWPVESPDMAARLIYTGYIAKPGADSRADAPAPGAIGNNEILVSGGGSAAALPLFRAAIGAARLSAAAHSWRILVGHGVSDTQFHDLLLLADDSGKGNLVVERARRDFTSLLATSAVSVSQAGYNTIIDLLHARRPAVVVPYEEDNETDQILRARALAERGLCTICETATLTSATLLAAVEAAIVRGPPPKSDINLNGVARTVEIVEALLADTPVNEISAGWNFLRHRHGSE